jgi:hypothetical protein
MSDDELTPMQQIANSLLDMYSKDYMAVHWTWATHELTRVRLTPLGAFCEVLSHEFR